MCLCVRQIRDSGIRQHLLHHSFQENLSHFFGQLKSSSEDGLFIIAADVQ